MSISSKDIGFLRRALELAERGIGLVSPGALVGAVVVKHGQIVGEGFYRFDRRKHAEVLAIEKAGTRARGATLYLNLEPCSHFGRTPPCADFIIHNGIRRVLCSMRDPNALVAGRGFRKLRSAGIQVEVGALQAEARRLNEVFLKFITSKLPFVTLKVAMTLDGKIAMARQRRGSITWITCEASRARVHQLRHAHDAILVGVNTILKDNPLLTDRSRLPRRRNLLRVVLDSTLRTPLRSQLAETANADVLLFCSTTASTRKRRALEQEGIDVVDVDAGKGQLPWKEILEELRRREVQSVMIEGGGETNSRALKAGIIDKFHFFIAPRILGGGQHIPVFADSRFSSVPSMCDLSDLRIERIDEDLWISGYPGRGAVDSA